MTHIRIAINEEVMKALDYLKRERFPVLSYPEILKAVLSEAVTRTKRKTQENSVPESSIRELMTAAAPHFGVDDSEEVIYTKEDGKPFTY